MHGWQARITSHDGGATKNAIAGVAELGLWEGSRESSGMSIRLNTPRLRLWAAERFASSHGSDSSLRPSMLSITCMPYILCWQLSTGKTKLALLEYMDRKTCRRYLLPGQCQEGRFTCWVCRNHGLCAFQNFSFGAAASS